MASFALPVSVVPSGVFPGPPGSSLSIASLGAIVDTGATQGNTFRSFDINGNPGDQVAIIESADNFATDMVLVKVFNAGDLATPIQTIARYYRTYRVLGTGTMVVELNDIVSPSTPGTSGIVNGGQAGPIVIGTVDATSFSLESNAVISAVFGATSNVTLGNTTGTTTTLLQSGTGGTTVSSTGAGPVIVDSGTTGDVDLGTGAGGVDANAKTVRLGTGAAVKTILVGSATGASSAQVLIGSGGLGLGVAAVAGTATLDTPAAGTVAVGNTNATVVTLGNQTVATTTSLSGGTGGILVAIPLTVNAGVQVQGGTGTSSFTVGAAGTLALGSGTLANTVTVGTGAAVHTVTVGSTNTTSASTLLGGSGGIGVGVAAPGASGIAIDTTAAGLLTIGAANATTATIGGAACATINVGIAALATTITIGNVTGATAVAVNCGTGGATFGTSATVHTTVLGGTTGASATTIQAGSGALTLIHAGVTWTWPTTDGTNGQRLTTNGAGILSFAA